jgi:hypothetical protein
VTDAVWVSLCVADDNMVDEVDVDYLGGLAELAGDLDIRSARGRVARGMVVGNHEGRGAGEDGTPERLHGGRLGWTWPFPV